MGANRNGCLWPKAERLLLDCFAAKRTLILARRSAVSDRERTSRPSYSITSSGSAKNEGDTTSFRLFGLEVERELELGWRLHRRLGWVRALEDAVDLSRRAAEDVARVGPVGHQPTVSGEATIDAQRRKAMARGESSIAFEQHHYRVRSVHNQTERAVRETDIGLAG